MEILDRPVTIKGLKDTAQRTFGDMVKAVVDVERELLAIDAELHADLEALLMDQGSSQGDLWGINLYPDLGGEELLEFDAMINLRPSQGNMSRGVEDESIRNRIKAVVDKWVER